MYFYNLHPPTKLQDTYHSRRLHQWRSRYVIVGEIIHGHSAQVYMAEYTTNLSGVAQFFSHEFAFFLFCFCVIIGIQITTLDAFEIISSKSSMVALKSIAQLFFAFFIMHESIPDNTWES